MLTISTIRVGIFSFAVLASSPMITLGERITAKIRFDDRTDFIVTSAVLPKRVEVKPGQTFKVRFKYTKRPGCKGDVSYRLVGRPKQGTSNAEIDYPIGDYLAGWKAGADLWRETAVTIPQFVAPGEYRYYWLAVAEECDPAGEFKGTSPGHMLRSQSLAVDVVVLEERS